MANAIPISNLILEQQLLYFGKLARDFESVPRKMVFQSHSYDLVEFGSKRKRGRPRLQWHEEVYKHAVKLNGNSSNFANIVMNESMWREMVRDYCRNM
eukprot:4211103-Karenia_brevis.AAC.1